MDLDQENLMVAIQLLRAERNKAFELLGEIRSGISGWKYGQPLLAWERDALIKIGELLGET